MREQQTDKQTDRHMESENFEGTYIQRSVVLVFHKTTHGSNPSEKMPFNETMRNIDKVTCAYATVQCPSQHNVGPI